MKIFYFGIFIIALMSFSSCGNDAENLDPLIGCCANPPIIDTIAEYNIPGEGIVGPIHVYVPNVFTPNGDGFNDFFTVHSDPFNSHIQNIVISNDNGIIVFENSSFYPNNSLESWDGRFQGVIVEGIYDFELTIESDWGKTKTWTGKVCNFQCHGNEPTDFSTKELMQSICAFSTQSDGLGNYDSTLASFEPFDCLE